MYTPRPYQEKDIERILASDSGGALVAYDTGVGKTLVATEVARRAGAQCVLVVAPLNTRDGWERTFANQYPDLPFINMVMNKGAINGILGLNAGEPGVYFIGWELMRNFAWDSAKPDLIIADETHRQQNRNSAQHTMMMTANAPMKLALSATPFGNKVEGAFGTASWLWPKKYKDFWQNKRGTGFVEQFLVTESTPYSGYSIVGEKRPRIIVESFPVYVRHTARGKCCDEHPDGVLNDLPEVITHEVRVPLTPKQRSVYNQFEKEALAWLDEHPVSVPVPITQRQRLRQTLLAVPSVVEENGEQVVTFATNAKSSKIEALIEIVQDLPPGEPVLVWTHSQRIVPVVVERLRKKKISAEAWDGTVKPDDRDKIKADFLGRKVQVIVATIPALSEGVDGLQQACHTEVWLSMDEDWLMNKQAMGRIDRSGQTQPVNRFIIVAEDTIEDDVNNRLNETGISMAVALGGE